MPDPELEKYLLPTKKLLPTWLAFLLILLPVIVLIALVVWGNYSIAKIGF